MWQWDQGRLAYFEFEAVRKLAEFAMAYDLKSAGHAALHAATNLEFKPVDPEYPPWRNYGRVFKELLLVSDDSGAAAPTSVAQLLSEPGRVTSDEYSHFFARAFTEPSPARKSSLYDAGAGFRYPLLFALKYLLAKAATQSSPSVSLEEIIVAYEASKFSGGESDSAFNALAAKPHAPPGISGDPLRQMKESLLVICRGVSYLYYDGQTITILLSQKGAADIFSELTPVLGPHQADRDAEIRRRAALFPGTVAGMLLDYGQSLVSELEERGFPEGTKVQKTHVTIERNQKLRAAFFQKNPTTRCDVCGLETAISYPWAERVLDVHHLLPLASGTKLDAEKGTLLDDLVAVCPSCHRATHRFYSQWLKANAQADFSDAAQAKAVYEQMKKEFPGPTHA